MNPLLATITLFGGNFAPTGYAMCQGQTIAISQNTALFSLLGTTYGGNGTSTFQLPDLQGRVPIGAGNGAGLTPVSLGQVGGSESITLSVNNLPAHSHNLNVNTGLGNTAAPGTTTYLASSPQTGSGPNSSSLDLYTTNAPNTNLSQAGIGTIGNTGAASPFDNHQPYLAITYIIALQGVFPSRN